MEDLIDNLTNGNVTGVKVVLASVVMALAIYQVFLMAVGYGKLKLPYLKPKAASFAHRSVGDAIVVVTVVVAVMCMGYFGFEADDHGGDDSRGAVVHMVAGAGLLTLIAFKIGVVRWWHRLGRFLPLIGIGVFVLFGIVWLSSAGSYLSGGQ
ncbi:MAG: hypothetical protein QOG54_2071 [Actinomycetota bacterium]|jgi:hypothetical protein|nr:hypothetical protein [Actinomycetota bacterium]